MATQPQKGSSRWNLCLYPRGCSETKPQIPDVSAPEIKFNSVFSGASICASHNNRRINMKQLSMQMKRLKLGMDWFV